ncbi:putative RDD family membrane protein YckC [Phycicoccus badiiscoriae]|uniref:Putative RDD family membrane protein YckC n=1 Tax=Pedococcus badiiscoriae TaxID=642776 RepID=A0A852WAK4_9MICO|nr:putative RDD family membrane protein YckC [Pedococcus badiiscoriae]
MVDRKDIGSWLEGPGSRSAAPSAYPGERLGMPREGSGSMGRFGRRLVGVVIDWSACQAIAAALFGVPLPFRGVATSTQTLILLAIFALENLLLLGTTGYTLGHRIVGLRVASLDGRTPRPFQALVRTVLLCLFLPAMFWDKDGRGLHDKAAGTVIVRS